MSSVRPDSRVLRPHPGLVRWQRGLEAPRHLTACPAMNSGASLLPWLQKVMTDRVTPSCGGNLDLWGRYPGPVSRSPIRAACEVTRPAISLLMDEGAARSVDFAEGVPRGGTFVIDTRRSPEGCAAFRPRGPRHDGAGRHRHAPPRAPDRPRVAVGAAGSQSRIGRALEGRRPALALALEVGIVPELEGEIEEPDEPPASRLRLLLETLVPDRRIAHHAGCGPEVGR